MKKLISILAVFATVFLCEICSASAETPPPGAPQTDADYQAKMHNDGKWVWDDFTPQRKVAVHPQAAGQLPVRDIERVARNDGIAHGYCHDLHPETCFNSGTIAEGSNVRVPVPSAGDARYSNFQPGTQVSAFLFIPTPIYLGNYYASSDRSVFVHIPSEYHGNLVISIYRSGYPPTMSVTDFRVEEPKPAEPEPEVARPDADKSAPKPEPKRAETAPKPTVPKAEKTPEPPPEPKPSEIKLPANFWDPPNLAEAANPNANTFAAKTELLNENDPDYIPPEQLYLIGGIGGAAGIFLILVIALIIRAIIRRKKKSMRTAVKNPSAKHAKKSVHGKHSRGNKTALNSVSSDLQDRKKLELQKIAVLLNELKAKRAWEEQHLATRELKVPLKSAE